jgi:hypothetical protein
MNFVDMAPLVQHTYADGSPNHITGNIIYADGSPNHITGNIICHAIFCIFLRDLQNLLTMFDVHMS